MYLRVAMALTPISLLIFLNILAAAASSNHTECAAKLEALSTCLPFVSASPTATIPQKCCDDIAFAFKSTGSGDSCICHLLQQPHILGFALNLSSVLSLPSLCKTIRELSAECREESLPDERKEGIRKPYMVIKGGCRDTQCCLKVCKKHLPTTLNVISKVTNGAHLCYCRGT